jgi:tetratricopeptide (TPR) repeat protein
MSSSARIDELRKKFDENPRRYFAPLANEYRKAGDFDQAIFICQEYLPQQPGHMSGHIVFGQALFEAKRLPEARTVFETALTLDPENLIALRHLADISRDLGESTVARGWYERVLQADPRNEEIAAIMSSLPAAGSPAPETVETPAPTPTAPATPPAPSAKAAPGSAAAPTMELTSAAVQEMVRARQAAQQAETPSPEKLTLDQSPTVEVIAATGPSTVEGFETTSQEGLLDIPSGGMVGLELTAASQSPESVPGAAPEGLDSLTLDDFSLPASGTTPVTAAVPAAAPAAAGGPAGGLLDFDSFELGGEATAPSTEAATPSLVVPAMDFAMPAVGGTAATPVDGGHEPVADFDFDIPTSPPASRPSPQESVPTMVMDAIGDAIPVVMDVAEDALPVVIDSPPSEQPPVAAREAKAEPAESTDRAAASFVTETMAQLYLEQGHRAEAIEIYKQLVAARPQDAELRGRLEAVEHGTGSRTPRTIEVPVTSPEAPAATDLRPGSAPAPARFVTSGPTIRTVLRVLFGIEGQSTNGHGNGAGDGEVGSIDTLFSTEPVAEGLGPLASAFDGGYVAASGSIDLVFESGSR